MVWQGIGCYHINGNTQKVAKLEANGTQVKQGGVWGGVDQDIQITVTGIPPLATEPKTRGFFPLCERTISRTSVRYVASAWDGVIQS